MYLLTWQNNKCNANCFLWICITCWKYPWLNTCSCRISVCIGWFYEISVCNVLVLCRHGTTGTLLSVLASEPSDYSYFNKALLRAWAGPAHWRIGPLSKGTGSIHCLLYTATIGKYILFLNEKIVYIFILV